MIRRHSPAYDLENDLDEMHNLYGKPGYDELTRQLKAGLEELRKETNDTYEYKPTGLPLYPEPFRRAR